MLPGIDKSITAAAADGASRNLRRRTQILEDYGLALFIS